MRKVPVQDSTGLHAITPRKGGTNVSQTAQAALPYGSRTGGRMSDSGAKQKSVLITGATDGLGRAAALLLAQRGYRVFAAGRSSEKRAQLDALAREKKLPMETLELDVCDDASVQRAVAHVLAKAGRIDVLFNNAGVNFSAAVEDLRMEDWRRQFETNFFG